MKARDPPTAERVVLRDRVVGRVEGQDRDGLQAIHDRDQRACPGAGFETVVMVRRQLEREFRFLGFDAQEGVHHRLLSPEERIHGFLEVEESTGSVPFYSRERRCLSV